MKRRRSKRKIDFMKVAVLAVLVQVFAYTWAHLILSAVVGVEIAPTTSCAFYAFCGAEAGLLAWLKKLKQKNESEGVSDELETDYFSETDQP